MFPFRHVQVFLIGATHEKKAVLTVVDRAADKELRFGYTPDDLDRLAMFAVTLHKWRQWISFKERAEIAWSAIAEHLCAAQTQPTDSDLFKAAWRAIRLHGEADWKSYGMSKRDPFAGEHSMPRFVQFWTHAPGSTPEELVVDQVAVMQILNTLPALHTRLFIAYAEYGNYEDAAASLGLKHTTFVTYISLARRAFLAQWHEGEKPSRVWGLSNRRRRRRL